MRLVSSEVWHIATRRCALQRLFSIFPDGWPGVGLVILRIAAAADAIGQGIRILTVSGTTASVSPIVGLFAVVAGFAFLVGFMTPIVGTTLALGYLIDAVSLFVGNGAPKPTSALMATYLTIISFALALTGPGAFSVDARLFDRVEIIIPERRRPPSD